MEDEFCPSIAPDLICQRIESLCNLAEVIESLTNKETKKRLLQAMDMLMATMPGTDRIKSDGLVLSVV